MAQAIEGKGAGPLRSGILAHRYVLEDVPFGLVFLERLARGSGIAFMDSIETFLTQTTYPHNVFLIVRCKTNRSFTALSLNLDQILEDQFAPGIATAMNKRAAFLE